MTSPTPVHYRIDPVDPRAHLFQVTLQVAAPDGVGQLVSLPAWIPGSYLIRDFSRHIVTIRAASGASAVAIDKIDKSTWRCAPCKGPLEIVYQVYAWDLSVRGAHLDETHGYFNGPCVFLMVHGQEGAPCTVDIAAPAGGIGGNWRVATTLPAAGAEPYGFGRYAASDYDELIDHPVEMGTFDLVEFLACGVRHEVAVTGRHRADLARLARDLAPLCETQIRLFGEPAPFDRYLFLVMAVGDGYGGLEHRSSTSLMCKRDELPRADESQIGEDYRNFLALCSHEYFHSWNVKRIKPLAFTPYDLSREGYTRLLWAFEGITSYYDDLALHRSGLIPAESYLEMLSRTATRLYRGSGRFKQPVAESSFDAWTKFYRQDENSPNAIVSYYTKGALVALALDLKVRLETNGRCTLDAIMVELWRRYGKTGAGLPEEGFEALAREVSGLDLGAFFDQTLRGTDELPLAELLAAFGVGLEVRPAESDNDKGGKPAADAEKLARRPSLGARFAAGEPKIAHVVEGGAAHQAGLAAGDIIVAVDGLKAGNVDKMIERCAIGSRIHIHAFRRDELMEFDAVLQPAQPDTCVLRLLPDVEPAVAARRAAWLSGR